MDIPSVSHDELKEIFDNDTGFNNLLGTLSDSDSNQIKLILANQSFLANALKALPEPYRGQAETLLTGIFETPQKALELHEQCRFFEARTLLEESIKIYSQPPSTSMGGLDQAVQFIAKRVQALCSDLLADVEWALGNTQKSGQYHNQALELSQEINDLDTTVKALLGLGTYHWNLGDFDKSLDFCTQAQELISGKIDRWRSEAKILTTLSVIYSDLGQHDPAIKNALQAVDLSIQYEDPNIYSICLNNLGCLYMDIDETALAEEAFEEGLTAAEHSCHKRHIALLLCNLASCLLRKPSTEDNIKRATAYLTKSFALAEKINSVPLQGLTANIFGMAYQAAGNIDLARESFNKAAELYKGIGAKSIEAAALNNLALLLRDEFDDPEAAFKACAASIEIVESIRNGLRKEQHRMSFSEIIADPYALAIDCLLRLNRNNEAFEYIERAKSRALLELIKTNINYLEILEKDSDTFQQAIELLQEIEEIQNSLDSVNTKGTGDGNWDQERIARHDQFIVTENLLHVLEEKQKKLDETLSNLATFSPDTASLFQVMPSRIFDTQKILDNETLLLAMYQSENSLELFLIGNNGQILTKKFAQSARQSSEDIFLLINNIKKSKHLDIRSHDFIRQIRSPLTHFYDSLIEPFSEHINRAKRLIISPHLFWHYFPFQSLYCQKDKHYLIDKVEICITPTASILASCLNKEQTSRDIALILAKNNGDLPYVDKEADLLAGAFYPRSEVYKNTDAYFKRTAQKHFDVIHFACHGSFNGEFPFLSGIDIPPEADSDRRTTLLDFFSQKLESSLVTLSACESGLNQFTVADELIGLSRGLFYAGTASIMASLWQVTDASTCYLMENFYWHYVKNKHSKTRSLQLAMQAVKAKEEYVNPYFWAPFFIMGDWR